MRLFFSFSFFLIYLWLIGHFVTAFLIKAAILHFSCRLHLFTSRYLSPVVLMSDLLYQSAAFIFLDGSRVSEGLVKINLSYG